MTDTECYGNTGKGKGENIRLVVQRNQLKNPVYVGDTSGDAQSAKDAEIDFIYAAYGFGEVSDKDYIAKIDSFEELKNILL